MTELDLKNVQEQIQEDLICILDGCDNQLITNACQAVVNNFKPLLTPERKPVMNGPSFTSTTNGATAVNPAAVPTTTMAPLGVKNVTVTVMPGPVLIMTTKEYAEHLGIEYATAAGLLAFLRTVGGIVKEMETRPNPRGKGKGSSVYGIPSVFSINVQPPPTVIKPTTAPVKTTIVEPK